MTETDERCDAHRAAWPWRTLIVWMLLAFPAAAAERGLPQITSFPAEVHRAGPQTFDIAQDARGVLYFGNLHGLLSFDGAWWRLLKLPDDQVALAVSADRKGRVAIGMVNDLGYLARQATGEETFRSLLPQVSEGDREFGDVRAICPAGDGFLYVAESRLLFWDGNAVRALNSYTQATQPRGCLSRGADVLLSGPAGISTFHPATMRITPGPITERIVLTLPSAGGRTAAVTRDGRIFITDQTFVTAFAPDATAWLKGKLITGGCTLADGRMVITTRQDGLVLITPDGGVDQIIGAGSGLPDSVINAASVDREGALWLAMEGPLVRIDLTSPVTVFDGRRGLRGAASDVARHQGRLYVASTHGLYAIDASGQAVRTGDIEAVSRLFVADDEMLIAAYKGIYRLDAKGRLERIMEREVELYDLSRSRSDPSRIWMGTGEGLESMRRIDGVWKAERLVPGAPSEITSVVERDGVVWAGTLFNGIVRIEHPLSEAPRVRQFGSGEMNVFDIGERIVLVRANGNILAVDGNGELVPDPELGHVQAPRGFFAVVRDAGGALWINSTPPRRFTRSGNGKWSSEGTPQLSVTAADIQTLRATPDGRVWFASDKGLFRWEPGARAVAPPPQPPPLVTRVIAGREDTPIAARGETGETPRLKHDFGRMRIELAPVSYRPGVSYQYRLDPIDTGWSAWRDEPFVDYTTLEHNDYVFRVRARGPAMVPGEETWWSFAVLPPWYRTHLAYALWVALASAVVITIFRIRTSTLHRKAERLRQKVAEKTAELQETVALLESANTQLEALSLEDDLTGIANRRSFDRALADEWNRARRHQLPLALILLDLDHFKALNDRLGHPAGDECLRQIGAFLAATIRRSGEVVARYGGEEFAILLPGVDADIAIRVAETLRDGIERLNIPSGRLDSAPMTASCGVAGTTPCGDRTQVTLVVSADAALYAAKHSGRNCVRVADDTDTGTWMRDTAAS